MSRFIGREKELRSLRRALDSVDVANRRGQCLLIRGRRRVGKSHLVEEFTERAGVPTVFFAASRQHQREVELFTS